VRELENLVERLSVLVEDPVINRGGCKVVTDTSQIDATLESRLASLMAPLLAGARAVDEPDKEA
jgi:flagellar assembly protein FliH